MQLGSKYLTGCIYMKKNAHRFILTDLLVTNPSKLKKKISNGIYSQISWSTEESVN